jgi:translation initiation factor eIF-2B subunit gamma
MPPNLENIQRNKQDLDAASISNIDPKAQVSADSLVAATSRIGERTSIKKSLIGRHCVIGKNVRLSNAIVWDFVNIADGYAFVINGLR